MLTGRELTRQRLAIMMDEAVRQISAARHDQRHLNYTLFVLLEQGQTEQAATLLACQLEAPSQKPCLYCENVSVNAAVSYYAEQARRQGIACDIRLCMPKIVHTDELSLAMAVSNLMENAINACKALPEEQRALSFTAVDTGQLILEMSNPYAGEITLDKKGLPIAREEGHGGGTQSVAAFVKSCDGGLLYEAADGVFWARMLV